jgi:hypothetical protein
MTPFERMRAELLAWTNQGGMSPSVLLQLNEPLRSALKRILRQGPITFPDLAQALGLDMPETEAIADLLVACGLLKTSEADASGDVTFAIRHTKTHRPEAPVGVWSRLFGEDEGAEGS